MSQRSRNSRVSFRARSFFKALCHPGDVHPPPEEEVPWDQIFNLDLFLIERLSRYLGKVKMGHFKDQETKNVRRWKGNSIREEKSPFL